MNLNELYDHLMDLNRSAFAAGEYDVAYHVMMAALHCAESLEDASAVERIEHLAIEQLESIDARAPSYEHSSASAAQRGHVSIYRMAATQAHGRWLILRGSAPK
jgi:hypothetical protein